MAYDTILFDLDGTLTDSAEGIARSVQYALEKFGMEEHDPETLRRFMGPPLVESFRNIYGFDPETCLKGVEYYRERYTKIGWRENRPYEGIDRMLKKLQDAGKKLVVATSKPEVFTFQILELFHLNEYFDLVVGASLDRSREKKADVIAYALEQCKEQPEGSIVMVGDRCYDIDGAHTNGLPAIGVTYGFGMRDELEEAGAQAVVDSVAELEAYLLSR